MPASPTQWQGPPFVIVPEWISNVADGPLPAARANMEWLRSRHTVIQYERYGSGMSDRNRTDMSLEPEVQALEAVTESLGLRRFVLYGWSAGGPAAVTYAATYPRRVTHLILWGTFAWMDAEQAELSQAIGTLMRVNWGIASKTVADLVYPGAPPSFSQFFADLEQRSATAEVGAGLWNMHGIDVRDLCRKVRAPTLVMHREGDTVLPFRLGQELAAYIPKARFVSFPGDAHGAMWQDSHAVRTIAEFLGHPLDQLPGSPSPVAPSMGTASGSSHDVFLSYAAEDRETVDCVLKALERAGIRCWIAPRDIRPDRDYADAIVQAIRQARLVVVVFSTAANRSPHVRRQLERATSADLPIIPLRIEDTQPSAAMEYFLSTPHWLNAFPGPLEPHLEQLAATAKTLLKSTAPPV